MICHFVKSSFLFKFICLTFLVLSVSQLSLAKNIIIYNPIVTNWGDWGAWENCPNDTFAIGFQLKTEAYIGSEDDTALNAVRLFCDKPGEYEIDKYISSSIGEWGDWGQVFYCEGLLVGFQLRSEDYQKRKDRVDVKGDDNTAANNMKAFCATSNIKKTVIEGDGMEWGSWTRPQNCLPRQSICGIQTQVEKYAGSYDDTALNNIRMECCDIPDPSKTCKPKDNWELLIECDNSAGLVPLKCTFKRKNGISITHSESEGGSTESSVMLNVGFTISYVSNYLSSNFQTNLSVSVVTKHNWKTESSQTWNEESGHSAEFDVAAGMISSLYQVVGKCKYYDVFTTKFRKIDNIRSNCSSEEFVTSEREFVWGEVELSNGNTNV